MRYAGSFSRRLGLRITRQTAILFLSIIVIIGAIFFKFVYDYAVNVASSALKDAVGDIEKTIVEIEASTGGNVWYLENYQDNANMLKNASRNIMLSDTVIMSCSIGYEPFQFSNDVKYFCPFSYKDDSGNIHSMVRGGDDYDYFHMDWYQIPKLLGRGCWIDPSFDSDGSGKMIASYAVPLYNESGIFFGVLKTDVDLNWLTDKVMSVSSYGNSHMLLAGGNGALICHPDKGKILVETLSTIAEEFGDDDFGQVSSAVLDGHSGIGRYNFGEDRGFAVYTPLSNGWSALLLCNYEYLFDVPVKLLLAFILIAFIGVVLLYLSTKKIIEYETVPITELSYAALNIAQGNFNAVIPAVASRDELLRLHNSLAYMENSISKYIQELRTTTASNERFESELNIAREIQMQMLPSIFPESEDVDLYAGLHPAKEVGGDLYDFFIKDRRLYFALGDVSGKGVPAALYMAITRSAFRFIAGLSIPMNEVISQINNTFCDGNTSGMFVTLFAGYIDLDTLQMSYCNAGHNPVLIVGDGDSAPYYLRSKSNIAAGLFENFEYEGETMQLEKGMRLLIYTDGVTEAETYNNDQYGEQRLLEFASERCKDETSEKFVEHLFSSVKKFTGGNPQNDDITIMSIKL